MKLIEKLETGIGRDTCAMRMGASCGLVCSCIMLGTNEVLFECMNAYLVDSSFE